MRAGQRVAEESLLGSTFVSPGARAAQTEALTATANRLAARASPASVVPEQAGQAVRDAVTARAAAYNAAADAAYTKLRAIEAQAARPVVTGPAGTVTSPILSPSGQPITTATKPPMTVMCRSTSRPPKRRCGRSTTTLKREAELVPLMGDKARALTALDRLMQAPDLAPLSIADSALGELKNLSRVDQTFRRTAGQGIAAEAVTNLDKAVRARPCRLAPMPCVP